MRFRKKIKNNSEDIEYNAISAEEEVSYEYNASKSPKAEAVSETDEASEAVEVREEVYEYEIEKPGQPEGFYIAKEGEKLAGTGLFGDVETDTENLDASLTDFENNDGLFIENSEKQSFFSRLLKHKVVISLVGVAVIAFAATLIIMGINSQKVDETAYAMASATTTVDFQTKQLPTNAAVDLLADEEFELVDPADYVEEDVYPANDSAGYGEEYLVDYFEPAAGTYFGIDVSTWQGYIDWNQVAASGVKFAFIRVGYRGWGTGTLVPDSNAIQNIQGASAAGINVGVYFYSTACNYEEGVEEGKWVCQFIKGYNITYPVVCDYEDFVNGSEHRSANTDYNSRTQAIMGFLDAVSARGYQAMVYSSKSFLTNNFDTQSFVNKGYKVWVAHYPDPPYPETSRTSYSTTSYNVWQYTDKGIVSGINGYVDLDFAYYGSAADDLFKETTTTAPPTTTTTTTTTKATETTTTTTKKADEDDSEESTEPEGDDNLAGSSDKSDEVKTP